MSQSQVPVSPKSRLSEILNKYNNSADFTLASHPTTEYQASPLPQGSLISPGLEVDSKNPIVEYILANGDTLVHFSCSAIECLPENLFIRRVIVLTENALYKVPQTATRTGLFFNARVPLRDITQIIVSDIAPTRFEVDFFGMRFGSANQHLFTLNFGAEFEVRRECLIVLRSMHPSLDILQHKTPSRASSPRPFQDPSQGSQSAVPPGGAPASGPFRESFSPSVYEQRSASLANVSTSSNEKASASATGGGALRDLEPDIALLRNMLHDGGSVLLRAPTMEREASTSMVDNFRRSTTPTEGTDEEEDRRKVRAMLDQMEQKIQQKVALEERRRKTRLGKFASVRSASGLDQTQVINNTLSVAESVPQYARDTSVQIRYPQNRGPQPNNREENELREKAVKPGESIAQIAQRYGVSTEAIRSANLSQTLPASDDATLPEHVESLFVPVVYTDKDFLGQNAFLKFRRWRETGGLMARTEQWTADDSKKLVTALTKQLEVTTSPSRGTMPPSLALESVRRVKQVLGMVKREQHCLLVNPVREKVMKKETKPGTRPVPFRLSTGGLGYKDATSLASSEDFAATLAREGDEHRQAMNRIRLEFAQRSKKT